MAISEEEKMKHKQNTRESTWGRQEYHQWEQLFYEATEACLWQ